MGDNDNWQVVQKKKNNTKVTKPQYVPQSIKNPPNKTNFNFNKNNDLKKNNMSYNNNNQPKFKKNDDIIEKNIQHNISDTGETIVLPDVYTLWCHSVQNDDWSLAGYTKLCDIGNVSEFWKVFNNIHKLNFKNNNFFFMKHGVNPIWEDKSNRDGGICSFRVLFDESIKTFELLCVYLVCDQLVTDNADINGISVTPKNAWCIIKIWNKNKNNKIDKLLHNNILNKFKNVSILYKENNPEY